MRFEVATHEEARALVSGSQPDSNGETAGKWQCSGGRGVW